MNPSGAAVKAGWLLLAGPHLDHLGGPFPLVLLYVLAPLIVPYPYSTPTVCCDDFFLWSVYKAAARLTRTVIGAMSCIRTSENEPSTKADE